METTRQLYERAKEAAGVPSDYAMAKVLGVTRAAASQYKHGTSTFDDERAAIVADLLKVEPGYVAACAHAERSKSAPTKAIWARVAALLIAVSPAGPASGNQSGSVDNNAVNNANYAKKRRGIATLARLFGMPEGIDHAAIA